MKNGIFRNILYCTIAAGMYLYCINASPKWLQAELKEYVFCCPAEIGIAVVTDTRDTICVNAESSYPMNSVMKLYQAMAVAATLQAQGRGLDSLLPIKQEELHPKTYSPMRKDYPSGDFQLSIARLLKYSLQESDNNACDILFRHVVGIEATEKYIQSLGIKNFAIRVNERDMYENNAASYKNWNLPLSCN
ncbi:MAG: class A beta-lactamase-related serine hydrolase [Odoribacter sp.]|nr:class A beta-lactamase-related serine hydrolase [Odoribacter sp.]